MSSQYITFSGAWKNDIGFLQAVSGLSGLSVAIWQKGKPVNETCWTSCGYTHPCFSDDALRASIEDYLSSGAPSIFFADDHIIYGAVPIGAFALAIGPAAIGMASQASLRAYQAAHGMDERDPIRKTDLSVLTQYMKLIYYHFTGSSVLLEEFPVNSDAARKWRSAGDMEIYQLNQSENERTYQSGADFEKSFLQAVENGDTAALKALLSGPAPEYEEISELSIAQSKEREYLAVSIITLLTRAAISGGVPIEAAHQLGAVYLTRLGRASSAGEPIFGLTYNAMFEFAELVRRTKEEKSRLSYVEACKAYIEANFRKGLQVSEIAPAIGISRTYLSCLFREAEGITVQQYIQKEKCRHAARMLRYTDYTLSQIAQYNGFSSQSYFGTCFQAWYGMTPNAYRRANH